MSRRARATAVATAAATRMPVAVSESMSDTDLAVTDEMPVVREIGSPARLAMGSPSSEAIESQARAEDHSDVFVCRRSLPLEVEPAAERAAAGEAVTLFVYGWENVEPGPLSWPFPSLRAALLAVKTMRNAVEWCIASGIEWASIEAARANGAVLLEQNA